MGDSGWVAGQLEAEVREGGREGGGRGMGLTI